MTPDDKKTLAALRVLIVEDQPLITKLITMVLGSLGVRDVTTATDGAAALREMDKAGADAPFGLIICDWMMPGMDGITFLEKFRAMDKETIFVMLTAKTDTADFGRAKRAGANHFFLKPLEPDELELRLEAVLETSILV